MLYMLRFLSYFFDVLEKSLNSKKNLSTTQGKSVFQNALIPQIELI